MIMLYPKEIRLIKCPLECPYFFVKSFPKKVNISILKSLENSILYPGTSKFNIIVHKIMNKEM